MTLPTRDQLNDEVNHQFAQRFPDAPARLDDKDPVHASWINAWLSIRDEVLNDWVDQAFAGYFPHAGTLDPNNPEDARLIDYWTDMHDQIRDGTPGRYAWNGTPDAEQPDLHTTSVVHDPAGGWVVTFDRQVSVEDAEAFLWPGGTPDGVQVLAASSDSVHLHGLTIAAVQRMTPEVSTLIQPDVLTTGPRTDPASGPSPGSSPPADAEVEIDETTQAKIADWTEHLLEGGHELASTAEVAELLGDIVANVPGSIGKTAELIGRAAGEVSKVLGPLADVFLVVWVGFQVVDAFRSERRSSYTQGFVYGVTWQALDEPDHLPVFADGLTYSADEHREAFVEGIAEGRAKAQDPIVRNRVILAVAALALTSGMGNFYAANKVLSELWRSNREPSPGDSETDTIRWPVPYDRNPLIAL
jgi:hypothetical protein